MKQLSTCTSLYIVGSKISVSSSQKSHHKADFKKGLHFTESLHELFWGECHSDYCLCYLVQKLNNVSREQFSHKARHIIVQDSYIAANAPKLEVHERCAMFWKCKVYPTFFICSTIGYWKQWVTHNWDGWYCEERWCSCFTLLIPERGNTGLVPSLKGKLNAEFSKHSHLHVSLSYAIIFVVRGWISWFSGHWSSEI